MSQPKVFSDKSLKDAYVETIKNLEAQVAKHHEQWIPTHLSNGRRMRNEKGLRREALISAETFGRLLATVGGWGHKTKSYYHAAARYRMGTPPWETEFNKPTQQALLRSIARVYGFLSPDFETLFLCNDLCELGGIKFIPGSFVYEIRGGTGDLIGQGLLGLQIFDVLIACPYPLAIMEYCRSGALTREVLEWLGPRTKILSNLRGILQKEKECRLNLLGVSEEALCFGHFEALAFKGHRRVAVKTKEEMLASEPHKKWIQTYPSTLGIGWILSDIIDSDREDEQSEVFESELTKLMLLLTLDQYSVGQLHAYVAKAKQRLQQTFRQWSGRNLLLPKGDGDKILRMDRHEPYPLDVEVVVGAMCSIPCNLPTELPCAPIDIFANLGTLEQGKPLCGGAALTTTEVETRRRFIAAYQAKQQDKKPISTNLSNSGPE